MTESLSTRMDRLAEAVTNSHVSLKYEGIAVDVRANGHILALDIEDEAIAQDRRLGPLIARLINEARDRAQAQVEDLVAEVHADPRVTTIVEQLSDTPAHTLSPATQEQWDEDYPHRPKSLFFD
ncbi:YbaB/EbfC family nucleoid-associated protein [Nocardia sp. NBC_01327]|uniref:YbaB/EbfC family nucleoid-associated protein n=1 Tax=Nocardia sp. NBC_01327 TaxID=2903593 RepID=UPI002E133988|nr:YbaB/EbfC family nucleoid-associated protein [Nocardia sp. NBC_01327]